MTTAKPIPAVSFQTARTGASTNANAMGKPDDVRQLRDQGLGATEIANRLNIARASVYQALAA